MNEQLKAAEAMGVQPPRMVVKKILESMLENRGRSEIVPKPYIKGIFSQPELQSEYRIDMNKCYPEAETGDCAYASSYIYADCDSDGIISVNGNSRIWLNDSEVFCEQDNCVLCGKADYENGIYRIKVAFKQGKNKLIIKKMKSGTEFCVRVKCSFILYPGRWSDDYLLCLSAVIPYGDFEGLEGFAVSELISGSGGLSADDLEKSEKIRFPKKNSYGNIFDFMRLYPEAGNSSVGYAYSEAVEKTELCIKALSVCRVFVNNKEATYLQGGETACIGLEKDDRVLIKTIGQSGRWGFEICDDSGMEISSIIQTDEKWICTGDFATKNGDIGEMFAPEEEIQFVRPYYNGHGGKAFWRFNSENLWVRMYTNSKFFGQWFYAIMVGLMGIRRSAELFGDESAMQYYLDSVRVMSRHFDYAQYDYENFGSVHIIPRCVKLDTWDDIGTVGMCLCDAYKLTSDPELKRLIDILASRIDFIPKFPDGTFYRVKTMWADDFYMSSSFLTRLCEITGEKKYSDMLLTQLRGYKKRLWMENEKIFSHIYFPEEEKASCVPWGRGNGWVMVSLTEILLHCKDETLRSEALELYRLFVDGVVKNQDECGMWHQVLNRPDSYIETSCSAMFALTIARGVNNGWLNASYAESALRAWEGIMKRAVDKNGDIYGVCLGSGCHMQAEYYFNIPTHKNDDHGTGIVLAAGCEIIRMIERI